MRQIRTAPYSAIWIKARAAAKTAGDLTTSHREQSDDNVRSDDPGHVIFVALNGPRF